MAIFGANGILATMPQVLQSNDFYPFGMLVPGRNYSSDDYRYGFNVHEKDDEVKGDGNSLNYTYRMHDARIGRFFAVDPLAGKYPHNSPFAFSENRVIDGVELEVFICIAEKQSLKRKEVYYFLLDIKRLFVRD